MLTKARFSAIEVVSWTRIELLILTVLSGVITILYMYGGLTFLHLPWAPLTIIGTAVAFIIGFQNNSVYGRIWEARKIWGGIVNTSRTWGMKIDAMVSNEHAKEPVSEQEIEEHKRTFVYRHIAWMTALRHAMRQNKKWEVAADHPTNKEWIKRMHVPEKIHTLEEEMLDYLSDDELDYTLTKKNKSAALLYLQSRHLKQLKELGLIWEFAFLELQDLLEEMFNLQGKSERIKNFPYPRQYATISYYFVRIFIILLPFAAIPEFHKIGLNLASTFPLIAPYFTWLAIPFCVLASWVFYTMERIGRMGENPFEGTANDVPISTIARGIEIDLLQLYEESNIPKALPSPYDIQM